TSAVALVTCPALARKKHRVVLFSRPGQVSDAVSTLGSLCSAFGTVFARYSIACRRVCNVVPSSRTIGSSKRFDQPLLAIGLEASGKPRGLVKAPMIDRSLVVGSRHRPNPGGGFRISSVPVLIGTPLS